MAIILVINENNRKSKFRLNDSPILIGRSSRCNHVVSDDLVSGKHIAIKLSPEGKAVFKDLNSTNGTYLNGNKILESFIHSDDLLQIGHITIYLEVSEMDQEERSLHTREVGKSRIISDEELDDEDDFSGIKNKSILRFIARKKGDQKINQVEEIKVKNNPNAHKKINFDSDSNKLSLDISPKKPKPKKPKVKEEEPRSQSIVTKIASIFNRDKKD